MTIKNPLRLRAGSISNLTLYISKQLNSLFPAEGLDCDIEELGRIINIALERMRPILEAVRAFEENAFDHFNTLQYSTFLYLVSNEYWQLTQKTELSERIFCLNRALNSIELFYCVNMPEIFLLAHGLGSVLVNTHYGNKLVIFQNVSVGRVGDEKPFISENVILFPGSIISGNTLIGKNCVVGAGVVLHNFELPDNTMAIRNAEGFVLKPRKRDFSALYFK